MDLNGQQLKQKAHHIGAVPENYRLMVEECCEEEQGRAFYVWEDADNQDKGITVELDQEGRLISLTKEDASFKTYTDTLPDERLRQKALQFVERHYPHAAEAFVFQEKKVTEDTVQYSYAQTVLDLPLPQTGFSVTVGRNGEVKRFRYDGGTDSFAVPKQIVDKETVISRYLESVELNLAIEKIHQNLYKGGDDRPHLVYEADLPFLSHPADSAEEIEMLQASMDGEETETIPLPLLPEAERDGDINEMIGFSSSLRKIREIDFGDSIVTVWREGGDPEPTDFTMAGFFKERNQNTLKIKKDKQSGKLKGMFSFIKAEGPPVLTEEACLQRALQFLYRLYPCAGEFFRMRPLGNEDNGQNAHFQFDVQYEGMPLRAEFATIIINRANGRVIGFFGPEIEPETLKEMNPSPAVSAGEAKAIFAEAFDVKLQWEREYKREKNDHYRLVYRPISPVFIDAHNGEVFIGKMI